jgi:hypothetical protein
MGDGNRSLWWAVGLGHITAIFMLLPFVWLFQDDDINELTLWVIGIAQYFMWICLFVYFALLISERRGK